ncbi:MAG TPA: molybdopterin-dependent oxidoreductase [Kofleriaceae bacterium]|nr:molybdopterin-dependent oxidoreductase [Kofleriaceae bacterium]
MGHDDDDDDDLEPAPAAGLSRRAFLGATGAGTAAAGLVTLSGARPARAAAPRVVGPGAVSISLKVNGTPRTLKIEPRTTLARALREELKLTGTKIGCDRGACGACTVHLDGAPALACTTLALEVGDRAVTTIEGLANGGSGGGKLHPIQQAFVEEDAMQCGFCTPGMVMSCAALLAKEPKPDRAAIQGAVSGNLCRCGTYPKVLTAVMKASGQKPDGFPLETRQAGTSAAPPPGTAWVGIAGGPMTAQLRTIPETEAKPWPTNAGLAVVGKPTPRLDGRAKVTGEAQYTSDVALPGMLHAKRVVSPHSHAIVKRIDTSKAERLAGVKAVFVVKKQEGATLVDPSTEKNGTFPKIRYAGQCVAAVAATTPDIAEEAAGLVLVEYEVLPAVTSLDAALQPAATLVYPARVNMGGSAGGGGAGRDLAQQGNLRGPTQQSEGDVDAALAASAVKVSGTFRTQVQTHSAMETHGIVADWKKDELTVYVSTQGTATVRDELATVFDLPKTKVRAICDFMGGGFGAKFGAGHYGVVAVELSRRAQAPVRLFLDRREEHTAVGNRPGTLQTLTLGATRNGALEAVDLTSHGTGGIATGAGVGNAAMRLFPAPVSRSRQYDVFMHAGPGAAFRAPGMPQGVFALDQLVDELAERIGIDSLVLRDRLDIDERDGSATAPERLARRLERKIGADRIGWGQRHAPGAEKGPIKTGIGVGTSSWRRGVEMDSACELRVARDGSVQLRSSVMDIGTGTRTALAMLVAEDLGLRPQDIDVKIGDTRWPIGPASGGSRTLLGISPAVRQAVHEVKTKLLAAVAKKLDVSPGELRIAAGRVESATNPRKALPWKQACAAIPTDELAAIASRPADWQGPRAEGYGGVQFAQVQVDTETGVIRVLRVVAVHECGRLINPLAIQSQINGGILHGISWALFEDRRLDGKTGRVLNANMDQYKILGARDTPLIDVILLDQYVGLTNTDAHGIGEPANVATAAALANAVYNAIGVRIRELPMTPRTVLAALRKGNRP